MHDATPTTPPVSADTTPATEALDDDEAPRETPRETRLRLNRLERTARAHAAALADAGHGAALVRLRGFFELAFTADHADFLTEELDALLAHLPARPDA